MQTKVLSALLLSATVFLAIAADWYTVDPGTKTVETDILKYQHMAGKDAPGGRNWYGTGIALLIDKRTGEKMLNLGNPREKTLGRLDGCGTGYAAWEGSAPVLSNAKDNGDYVEYSYSDGKRKKTERVYKGLPIIEINYASNSCSWGDDALAVGGTMVMVINGIDKNIDQSLGKKGKSVLWDTQDGRKFLEAVGGSEAACTYKNHLIYGVINEKGNGIGNVFPTAITVKGWKPWWDFANLINVEWFKGGGANGKKRWFYTVQGGREELLNLGKAIVDAGGKPDGSVVSVVKKYSRASRNIRNVFSVNRSGHSLEIQFHKQGTHQLALYSPNGRLLISKAVRESRISLSDMNISAPGSSVLAVRSVSGEMQQQTLLMPD
jgi:hypothetical protein